MQLIGTLRQRAGRLLIVLIAFTANTAFAESEGRILYHEPLKLIGDASTVADKRLSFVAHGRRFDLDVKPNKRLQRKIQRRGFSLLRGRVLGADESWVRLVRRGNRVSGMFSDDGELYVIEPFADIAPQLVSAGDNAGEVNAIFRLGDVMLPPDAGSCAPPTSKASIPGDTAYAVLLQELEDLPAFQAQGANRQIAVQAVADVEFSDAFGVDAEAQMLARLNIADGIFSDQFDMELDVASVDIFSAEPDPFTSLDSRDLLDEVADYRQASSAGTGITHLFTWRNLNGTTRGIAFLGSACLNKFGASLSQQSLSGITQGALITAHEIGHMFGAQHDGETTTDPGFPNPCETIPQNFLMAPIIGASDQFSQCSLDTMEAFLTLPQASCVTAIGLRIEDLETPLNVQVDANVAFDFSIRNTGGGDATGVVLNLSYPPEVELTPVNIGCNVALGTASCPIGDMAEGEAQALSFNLLSSTVGSYLLDIGVATALEPNADNEQVRVNVTLDAPTTQGGGGGGGGGGAMQGPALLVLGWMALTGLRRLRNRC